MTVVGKKPTTSNEPITPPQKTQQRLRRLTEAYIKPIRVKSTTQVRTLRRLEGFYKIVRSQLIKNQSYTTGLFPRYSTETKEGYVRDSIYCAMACWASSIAFEKQDDDKGRSYELSQSAVKTMRGILFCWMRQSDNLEKFKTRPTAENALHSKFNLTTGEPVSTSEHYGHLQLDVVALYLIVCVQMISAGLQIIFTQDEVSFIQNLIFYIERAYRIPEFGIWERGTRYNVGAPELHASTLGMVKAALEAVNGFNVYGSRGTSGSVIYVDIDGHNRNRTTFETLLPRESSSKNTDAALIPTICWPGFATHDQTLLDRAVEKCVRRLQGQHGLRRFLRDGYRTACEHPDRRFYTIHETCKYENIECQWPIFFIYLWIDAIFRGNKDAIHQYHAKVQDSLVSGADGNWLVPECYFVPEARIPFERSHPGSQTMLPYLMSSTDRKQAYFLWGQALYIIGSLLFEEFLQISDIDPVNRHLPASQRPKINHRHSVFQIERDNFSDKDSGSVSGDPVVQIALISESAKLQTILATYGIQTQTPHHVEPVQIWPSGRLVKVFEALGKNERLLLSGRPPRPIGALGTCKIYRVFGDTIMCYPLSFELKDFYLASDPAILIDDIKKDLNFVAKRWKLAGRPTFCVLLREENLLGDHFSQMLELLVAMRNGYVDGVRVHVGRVQNLLSASCVEHLDFAVDFDMESIEIEPLKNTDSSSDVQVVSGLDPQPDICPLETDLDFNMSEHKGKSTHNLSELAAGAPATSLRMQAQVLEELLSRHGFQHTVGDMTVHQKLEHVCRQAVLQKNWYLIRFSSGLLRKTVDSLAPSITSLLVRGKKMSLGVRGYKEILITKPVTPKEIEDRLFASVPREHISAAVLQQELLIACGLLIVSNPEVFVGMLTINIGGIMEALQILLNLESNEEEVAEEDQMRSIFALSPTSLRNLFAILMFEQRWQKLSPLQQRQLNGLLNKVPDRFYDKVWKILERSSQGIVIAGQHLPQQPTLRDMTMFELTFSLKVESYLGAIGQPEYRQIVVELFIVIYTILGRNPELSFNSKMDVDELVRDGFLMFANDKGLEDKNNMVPFYELHTSARTGTVATYLAKAVVNALLKGDHGFIISSSPLQNDETCAVS